MCIDNDYTVWVEISYCQCNLKLENMPQPATTRDTTINIRARSQQRDLIDRAAEASGRNRSDFMLDAACRAAEDVLLDRRLLVLDDEAWAQFNALMDAPAAASGDLERLLHTRPVWER